MANSGRNFRSNKNRFFKPQNNRKKFYLDAGLSGFFLTCNFREKDCIRESYNLLNEYADILHPNEDVSNDEATEEEDISDALTSEVKQLKATSNSKIGERRFQAVDTGVANCIFIRSSIADPVALTSFIFDDLSEKKQAKTRQLLRLMPILTTCRADMKSIVDAAGLLFDQHFLKEPKSFSVIFNRRYNSVITRDDVIKELADLVLLKNSGNKVDLKSPELAIIVEVIKGFCLLSIIPKYFQRKKYNIFEICNNETKEEGDGKPQPEVENKDSVEVSVASDEKQQE